MLLVVLWYLNEPRIALCYTQISLKYYRTSKYIQVLMRFII